MSSPSASSTSPSAPSSSSSYLQAANERVVIFDGASGSNLQTIGLTADDFGGPELEGCNEMLVLTRPDVITELHDSFLRAGVDAVETNTFGAFAIPLGEYNIPEKTYEINVVAARLAKEVASAHSTSDRPRWVAGSIGPGTKMPSLGQIRFAELRDAYQEQARGLLDGGVDLLLIETQFDLLGLKAAVVGSRRAMEKAGRHVPIQAQVTMELTGRMLPGTEIGAALTAIEAMRIDVIGLNCATGPVEMSEHLRHLSQYAHVPISCLPNAGLPSVVNGHMHYDLTPAQLAEHHHRFVSEFGVNIIGGCCGTTPEHMAAVVSRCSQIEVPRRSPKKEPGATSLYTHVPFAQDLSFLVMGERTNANGSKAFRDAMLAEDWDTCVAMARDQVKEGSHVLDVCVDYVGRDGTKDMDEIAQRFATQAAAPLVLDSTEPQVMEAGLQWIGGKAILNSANLEDGEAEGSRIDRVFKLAREYGAAVVVLLIDERGQARDVEWKMEIAHRIYRLAIDRYGMDPTDLIFDALTFPLSTGDDDLRGDAMATIEAIRRIKLELPGASCTLGVSNVSFGLKPAARVVLNSVFLSECVAVGMDAAIVHAAKILPLHKISDEQKQVCLDLIYDRRRKQSAEEPTGYDPLMALLAMFENVSVQTAVKEDRSDWTIDRLLGQRIIDGDRDGLEADLDRAMGEGIAPLTIINDFLLEGMKTVGELFGSGQMQLPFVLQSAETMKRSVAFLEPHMEHDAEGGGKGRIVLATVKGDVHDIGKNLVDIILTNNGYEVHNLGIKVPISEMIEKAIAIKADAIGMSGLLVKSTLIMRENLAELNERNLAEIPVLLGGAALTRTYVERDLRSEYQGRVFYGKDAFEGLHTMDRLMNMKRGVEPNDPGFGRDLGGRDLPARGSQLRAALPEAAAVRSSDVANDNQIFTPPFLGNRIVKGVALDDIAGYINETALFRNQWQFRPENGENDVEFKARIRPLLRTQLADAKSSGVLVPQVAYGHFPVNSEGNDLVVWTDDTRSKEHMRFSYPRQKEGQHLCIADFFAPDRPDYAAFHIATMGHAVSDAAAKLFADDKYQDYLMLHGIGVEMAEALAEYWHRRIREELGYATEDGPSLAGLFRQQYRGGRYSWGYPACPDLEDNAKVAELLGAERIGVTCSEETSWQYQPEQTTSAIICHHPQAKYFVAR
jgi:5-methyltetrahydrofolate--homocysteine methyltransferase